MKGTVETNRHLVPIAGGWHLWRWVRLRGAGFPAAQVQRLAAAKAAPLLDAWVRGAEELEAALETAATVCDEELAAAPPAVRAARRKLRKQLRAGTLPDADRWPDADDPRLAAALTAAAAAQERAAATRRDAHGHLQEEDARTADQLRRLVAGGRFREAVLWQNRQAVHEAFDRLLHQPAVPANALGRRRQRHRQQLAASYLQRYCVKNDTIGFFGPTGWGTLDEDAPAVLSRPGPTLLAGRTVYFEHWALAAVAAKLAEDPELRPWLAPRRVPTVWLSGRDLHHPVARVTRLSPRQAWLLAACDGERPARQLAREMLSRDIPGIASEEDVYTLLAQLQRSRLILWTLELPTELPDPERQLRRMLVAIGDAAPRQRALQVLDELETCRGAVARSAGDPEALDRALADLEATFRQTSGRAASRRPGEIYAARTLVYEDCRRDLQLVLGRPLLDRIAPALSLVLTSARWFTYTVASRFRTLLSEAYAELRRESGAEAVDFLRFHQHIEPHLVADQYRTTPLVDEVRHELQERWAAILELEPVPHPIHRRADRLAARVEQSFAAPGPGWPRARYHSPDLLLAAADVAAIRRGDFTAILGELHPATNTLLTPSALHQHPDPEALLRARTKDVPAGCVAPVLPQQTANRAAYLSLVAEDFHLEVGASRSWRPRRQVVEVGELEVAEHAGQLRVRQRGGREWDIIAFFEHDLTVAILGHFDLLPATGHAPRVMIDNLVIGRRRWTFEPRDLPFTRHDKADDRADLMLAGLRWAHRHGLPRSVFVSLPEEPKPFYLDFQSPLLVEIFARRARRASAVVLTEMLPGPEQLWLTDAAGESYTSELRVAVVDPLAWRPPGAARPTTSGEIADG